MKTYRRLVCDYIHIGNEPPESCPDCVKLSIFPQRVLRGVSTGKLSRKDYPGTGTHCKPEPAVKLHGRFPL